MTPTSKAKTSEILLRETRVRFPRFVDSQVRIQPIEKGGSDRKFYRVQLSPEQTIILVKYNRDHEENRHYVQIAEFLSAHRVCAPKIYFHDEAEGLIWIEDLGKADLWSYRTESWMVRRALYESALDEIAKLHGLPDTERHNRELRLPAEFNSALYAWEQNYFFENCLGRYFKLPAHQLRSLASIPVLRETADALADLPRVLIHRDFQSQNIIIRNGQAHLIDFQGMRPGLAAYDLASILFDPYVTLVPAERSELVAYYRSITSSDDQFEQTFCLCAMQRLMQALGAYGFLGLVKGNTAFLAHVAPAVASLRLVLERIDGTEALQEVLEQLRVRAVA